MEKLSTNELDALNRIQRGWPITPQSIETARDLERRGYCFHCKKQGAADWFLLTWNGRKALDEHDYLLRMAAAPADAAVLRGVAGRGERA